jgi:dihydrofolate reductase
MEIRLIWAMDSHGGIGRDNTLPWHYPGDLKHFKERTMGSPILMGRKTFESLPNGPLPGRLNLVLSRTERSSGKEKGVLRFLSPEEVLAAGRQKEWERLYVIGGAEVFRLFLDKADVLEVTRIDRSFSCNRYFPLLNWAEWEQISSIREDELTFQIYVPMRTR